MKNISRRDCDTRLGNYCHLLLNTYIAVADRYEDTFLFSFADFLKIFSFWYLSCCCPFLGMCLNVSTYFNVYPWCLSFVPSITAWLIETALSFQVASVTVEYMSWSASEKVGQIRDQRGWPLTQHCTSHSTSFIGIYHCYTVTTEIILVFPFPLCSGLCCLFQSSACVHCFLKSVKIFKMLKLTSQALKFGEYSPLDKVKERNFWS